MDFKNLCHLKLINHVIATFSFYSTLRCNTVKVPLKHKCCFVSFEWRKIEEFRQEPVPIFLVCLKSTDV